MYKTSRTDDAVTVRWRYIYSWEMFVPYLLVLLMAFVLFGICGTAVFDLIKKILRNPEWEMIIPFCFALFLMSILTGAIGTLIFLCETLRLDENGVNVGSRLLFWTLRKHVPLDRLDHFEVGSRPGYKGRQTVYCINAVGDGPNVGFSVAWSHDEMDRICTELNAMLEYLKLPKTT